MGAGAKPGVRQCLRCEIALAPEFYNLPAPVPCPGCGIELLARAFPATLRQLEVGSAGEALTSDELASCFFHPAKKADVACAQCGRFLCALCDLEVEGKHLCPTCLEAGMKKQTLATFQTSVTRWDHIALMLSLVPLTFVGIWFAIFTAPAALFIVFWKWKTPADRPVHQGKGRFVVAGVLALLQVIGWLAFFFSVFGWTRFRW